MTVRGRVGEEYGMFCGGRVLPVWGVGKVKGGRDAVGGDTILPEAGLVGDPKP